MNILLQKIMLVLKTGSLLLLNMLRMKDLKAEANATVILDL